MSIGFDADENGQSRQVQRQIPITPVLGAFKDPLVKTKLFGAVGRALSLLLTPRA
jgi:hypothetical protein